MEERGPVPLPGQVGREAAVGAKRAPEPDRVAVPTCHDRDTPAPTQLRRRGGGVGEHGEELGRSGTGRVGEHVQDDVVSAGGHPVGLGLSFGLGAQVVHGSQRQRSDGRHVGVRELPQVGRAVRQAAAHAAAACGRPSAEVAQVRERGDPDARAGLECVVGHRSLSGLVVRNGVEA